MMMMMMMMMRRRRRGCCKDTERLVIASENIGIKQQWHLPMQTVSHLLIGTMTN